MSLARLFGLLQSLGKGVMYTESSTGVPSAMISRNARDTACELCFVNGQTIKKSSLFTQDFTWSLCAVGAVHLRFVLV